ncbi:ATP-binding protein [Micromonospora sp. NPDC005305]|uniref:ATP-binding protein n=1 Tax=Micromonospora sp. NPDC005305 TaxID=3156875 RepID=UPI0033B04592
MAEAILLPTRDSCPDRLDAALARMAGRLSVALEALGDETAARFLRSLPGAAAAGQVDGSCLDLPAGGWQPVDRLVAGLALGPLDRDLMVLSLIGHHHEGVGAILRALHPEGQPWPTVGLAGTLAEQGLLAGVATRARLRTALAGSPLARVRAITADGTGPFPDRTLRPAPLLFEALAGLDGWPTDAVPDPRPAPSWGLDHWLELPAVRAAHLALERQAPVTVLATGDRPGPLAGRLAALVSASGRVPVVLRTRRPDPDLATAVLVLALARDVVPVLWSDDTPVGQLDLTVPPELAVPQRSVPLLVVSRETAAATWPRQSLTVPAGALDPADRHAAAVAALPELGNPARPIGPASIEPGDLAVAAADVRMRAALLDRPLASDDLRRELTAAVDAHTTDAVPPGAVLRHPQAAWDDLVLPPDRTRQLREAVDRMRAQPVVVDRWGFLPGRHGARGLRLLFCGPPGTGKTLAAEVIAAELGRDLLVVDLSRLVSKWIGETEKNLAAVFDAAERSGAALLFDEADALFAKRTEVGDARDRYANLETAYLLSRLERLDGVAVLASNLRQNLDAAFARRIEFIIPFDPPDEQARLALWRRHLPATAPVDPAVDLSELAALYDLSGALIRNAAVAAAFLAAANTDAGGDGGAGIGSEHLVHAIRREYVKAGQAFPGPPPGVPIHPSSRKESPRWPHRSP